MTLALLCSIQGLQLRSLENNPGVLPVKTGQAFKQEDKWTVIKMVDLGDLRNNLAFNVLKYKEFIRLVDIHKPFINEFYNIQLQTQNIHDMTLDKFEQLFPSTRVKRGILNPIGSLIKIITGNLDHDDALRYDKLISNVKNDQIVLDKKLTIVCQILNSLINSTETLQNNTLILDERLKRIERIVTYVATKENNALYATYVLSMFSVFINNFRTLYIAISEIETALALSKVSVLHQCIINSTELITVLESISKFDNLVYTVSLSNLVRIERTMTVKTYIKDSQIMFIIEIPLTDGNVYNYFKIYSVPILNTHTNRTSIIVPNYPYLLAKNSKYLPAASPCDEISADEFLCKEDDLIPYPEPSCVERLMRFDTDLNICVPIIVEIEDIKIQRIGPLDWIIFSRSSNLMTEKCPSDVTRKQVQGTFLLTINEDCELYLKGNKIDRRRSSAADLRYKVTPIMNLPERRDLLRDLNDSSVKVNIKGSVLGDIKHLNDLLKSASVKSDLLNDEQSVISTTRSLTIPLYIVFLVICISFIIWKYQLFDKLRIHRDSGSSDDFALDEGGVMPPQPLRRIIVNA